MVKLLVSPMNKEEAKKSIEGGADIIDVKNPAEGSLGANFPWIINEIADFSKEHGKEVSATIGDMSYKPGTASLAALGAACSGADYIKVGLFGVRVKKEAINILNAVVKAVQDYDHSKKVVAAGYADYNRIGSIPPSILPEVCELTHADGVMVDTAIKDGSSLFDFMTTSEAELFISESHDRGLFCALAGNISWRNIDTVKRLNPDILGVRTIVCENGRSSSISVRLVSKLIRMLK
ncbi:MAG TPA: (5-formylfuran-3-yl)methyl phosphate synthase [Archaeoglobaceae archaeon]|nr:(5-formylfuran-3-yl)methyl phosphate synthase [Archaeoglobaceae archaeon]